ncbi:MAG: CHY zinc finger protein [Verrucomicrobiota bacterium]|nr:CHY zinc finger protein [Verrucomicrobiota bacterium]
MLRLIHGIEVFGVNVDGETRCAHYHGGRDIIAIKFKCCGEWYPCHACHQECAGDAPKVWPKEEFNTRAVLCGACGYQLTVSEYLRCNSICPRCRRQFNPGCAQHYDLYFER